MSLFLMACVYAQQRSRRLLVANRHLLAFQSLTSVRPHIPPTSGSHAKHAKAAAAGRVEVASAGRRYGNEIQKGVSNSPGMV
jgi:hypothetical protein